MLYIIKLIIWVENGEILKIRIKKIFKILFYEKGFVWGILSEWMYVYEKWMEC